MAQVDDGKAYSTISKLNDLLQEVDISIVKNRYVTMDHLKSKGLYLRPHGIAKLVKNMKVLIKKL